jgi:hypothetical protein
MSKFLKPETNLVHFNDGAILNITREIVKSGSVTPVDHIRLGPNHVHAFITHADGSITDLGVSKNLLTNIGRDVACQYWGGGIPAGGAGSPATAVTSSSLTATGTPWTASNLATPQLGCVGFRVYASVTGVGTAPVYGNIISNTTSVLTLDQWWTAADGVGTTPANTNAFILGAGGIGSVRFMAITTDAGAAAAGDTVLASEITTGNCGRGLATYAHTFGVATFTLQKVFNPTLTFTNVHKMGLFTTASQAGADPMIFETVLNSNATIINGDQLTCTDTITVSG